MNHKILGLLLFSSFCLKADSGIDDPVLLLLKNLANRTHVPSLEIREEPHQIFCVLRSLALKDPSFDPLPEIEITHQQKEDFKWNLLTNNPENETNFVLKGNSSKGFLQLAAQVALKNREDAHALTASVQGSRQINDILLVKKMTSELNLTQGTLTLTIPTTSREETFLSKTYIKTTILEEKESLPETE